MCERCGPRLRALAAPLCGRCGAPTALVVTSCRACSRLRWITTARSALWLEGPALALVGRWKRGEISPARLAAALMVHELPRPPVDAIAVVPAVRDRLLLRGADPPAELARELGGWWEVPVMPLLRRTRAVRPQRGLDATARRGNVRGAFAARAGPRRLALVDDVYTTGATVDECARALRHARAAPWQTPGTEVPERGGIRCSSRSAAGTSISRSRSASTPNASSPGSNAT
jgi:predicted amidophosphoribosyltransferase